MKKLLKLLTQEEIKKQDKDKPAFKKYYMHGNSHFMGLDVHDVGTTDTIWEAGMIFSNEPGIYIPEKGFGIRLENDIIRNLTTGRNTLRWTITKGKCIDSDEIVVWNNLPPTPYANIDQTVCSSSAQMSSSPSNLPLPQPNIHSYYYADWTKNGIGTVATPSAYNTWVHDIPQQIGTYFIFARKAIFDGINLTAPDPIYAREDESLC